MRLRRSGWIVVPTVVSGDHPLHRFAHSVAAACPGSTVNGLPASSFAEGLRVPTRNLNAPVLVIVDQVEELITLSGHTHFGRPVLVSVRSWLTPQLASADGHWPDSAS